MNFWMNRGFLPQCASKSNLTILVGLVGGLGVDSCLVALILNLDGGTDS